MRKGTAHLLTWLVFVSAISTTHAHAQKSDTLDNIASSGVLTIGHRDSSIPFLLSR